MHHRKSNFSLFIQIQKYESLIKTAPIIVFDANLTVETISTILDLCRKYNKPGEYLFDNNFY